MNVKGDHERQGFPGIVLAVDTQKTVVPFHRASEVVWTAPYINPAALSLLVFDEPQTYRLVSLCRQADPAMNLDSDVAFLSLLQEETHGE
jgi:hypothetical protein